MAKRVRGGLVLAIDQIQLSGENMREDAGDLDELAWSIRKHGILQPLVVTERDQGYLLVCGHRRLAAARRAGLNNVPVVVRDLDDEERLELMIVENVHRKHLSPLEEAHAFTALVDQGMTQLDVASRIGKSQMYVSTRIGLLSCPEDIQQKVHKGEMSLYRAVDANRDRYSDRDRSKDSYKRDGATRWQIYYIDRLVGWLEAGRIPKDDTVLDRLILLGRALKAFSDRVAEDRDPKRHDGDDPDIVTKTPMCYRCGTLLNLKYCCDDHHEVCGDCRQEVHAA